jgi:hypothetical protein
MRTALALFLLLHGLAHLPGFLVPWRLLESEDLPYDTKLLGGRWDAGDTGIRLIGVLWLLQALIFGILAWLVFRNASGWPLFLAVAALESLLLSILGWPASKIGVWANAALLATLAAGATLY